MCNLYSLSKHQAGIRQMVSALTPKVGNFPPLPGIFPDYSAPVIRTNAAGERELARRGPDVTAIRTRRYQTMPWSTAPDPISQLTPIERVHAIVARLGCIGITGLLLAGLIIGSTVVL